MHIRDLGISKFPWVFEYLALGNLGFCYIFFTKIFAETIPGVHLLLGHQYCYFSDDWNRRQHFCLQLFSKYSIKVFTYNNNFTIEFNTQNLNIWSTFYDSSTNSRSNSRSIPTINTQFLIIISSSKILLHCHVKFGLFMKSTPMFIKLNRI